MTPVTKIAFVVAAVSIGGASVASALTQTPQTAVEVQPAVELADFDGNRGWSRGHGRRHGGGPRGGMMMILKQADTDGDNALTQEEIDAFVTARVENADADGSGDVSLEEFQTIWLFVTQRPMVRSFQSLDTDGDAVITQEEIDSRFGKMIATFDRNEDGKLDRADRPRRGKHHRDGRRHRRGDGKGGPRQERSDD